ncbi:glycosyltransferase 87 family protein [Nakamurella aerolata]|uniref:DUF2029 domain-containing protein n=1 Tax=Nakamurella aerolata TaxID=1656892 RepID=A0A849ABP7_9ACTN|nr:DUF2029 domain-containing protein [Nakamurella aerolata]
MTGRTDAPARSLPRWSRWLTTPLVWLLLMVSLMGHVLVMAAGTDGLAMIDLRVYLSSADHLGDGTLYTFLTPQGLPFTYPPFPTLLFWPLAQLPWPVAAAGWQLLCLLALATSVYLTLRLLSLAGPDGRWPRALTRGVTVTVTAVTLWSEPVRTTFNYGQVNLLLMALLLAGAVTARQWLAGVTVGLAAGIKLVPSITGLYYLIRRQWTAVTAAVVSFAVTVGICLLAMPGPTWDFFTSLMFDASRTGEIQAMRNQSLRGVAARTVGSAATAVWLLAAVLVLVLTVLVCQRVTRRGDRLAAFLAVQLCGLLVSPISWNHHWVWVLPLLLWCLLGADRRERSVRVLAWCWTLAIFTFAVPIAAAREKDAGATGRSWQWWELGLSLAYPVLGIVTLLVLWRLGRRTEGVRSGQVGRRPEGRGAPVEQ